LSVRFYRRAEKDLKKLPAKVQRRVADTIDKMEDDISKVKAAKLTGQDNLYRVRVGDHRVVFTKQGNEIVVARVGHRGEVYANLPALARIARELFK
jgi:mRNA interferase RelE/StbE